jgi:hypothetical protein
MPISTRQATSIVRLKSLLLNRDLGTMGAAATILARDISSNITAHAAGRTKAKEGIASGVRTVGLVLHPIPRIECLVKLRICIGFFYLHTI